MPLRSKAQQRLMYAVANNPDVAKKVGMKQSVANEFIAATPKSRFKRLKERISKKKA